MIKKLRIDIFMVIEGERRCDAEYQDDFESGWVPGLGEKKVAIAGCCFLRVIHAKP